MEDLWAFNEEAVARAIFASRIPVVSAVGHETDYTIADFVADCRAPTPSAAAELIVPDQIEIAMRVGVQAQRLRSELRFLLDRRWQEVEQAQRRLNRCRPNAERMAARLAQALETMRRLLSHELVLHSERLDGLTRQLGALSPSATLGRGYALVQHYDGRLVARAADAASGEQLRVQMADGGFDARVEPAGSSGQIGNGALHTPKAGAIAAEQTKLF
jgi:exodeoxyribonuclease VII large subunit